MYLPDQPNVGVSLILFHRMLTRGLAVVEERSAAFARDGFPNAAVQAGFVDYVCTLATMLESHHLSEDEVAFPYLRGKAPEAPFARLEAEHEAIALILAEIRAAIQQVGGAGAAGDALRDLHGAVVRLRQVWQPHIQIEEENFSITELARLMAPEEQVQLVKALGQYGMQHATPDYLTVPFMLFNLEGPERARLAREFPPVVIEQLVPNTWKDKWAAMTPFLMA